MKYSVHKKHQQHEICVTVSRSERKRVGKRLKLLKNTRKLFDLILHNIKEISEQVS
jgi:hypothetical protein